MHNLSPLGEKIFLDRYALKDMTRDSLAVGQTVIAKFQQGKLEAREVATVTAIDKTGVTIETRDGDVKTVPVEHLDIPIETNVEQMFARVAKGAAAVEQTEEKKLEWENKFNWLLDGFKFTPGGRILAACGTDQNLSFYNCFSGETMVTVKDKGSVPIRTLKGEHEVWSVGGVWRKATFASYGTQALMEVAFSNGEVVHATPKHEWVVSGRSGLSTACKISNRVTTDKLQGKHVYVNSSPRPERGEDWKRGVAHGVVYGDGSKQGSSSHVILFKEKKELSGMVGGRSREVLHEKCGETIRIDGLPLYYKTMPSPAETPAYWAGFVSGLIATDGHVDRRGHVMLHNSSKEFLEFLARNLTGTGIVPSRITMSRHLSPFTGEEAPCYKLTLLRSSIEEEDLLRSAHKANWKAAPSTKKSSTLKVVSVRPTNRVEEVFCCSEPETHTMTVGNGILTGQCFVIPSPKDSRQGVMDCLSNMAEIMSRGGGVGINISSLRPRYAYVKGVNGRSSGSVSWGGLYSFVTGLIEQGGSRRGALLLLLADWHPDVLEYINSKRTSGTITNANISVAISDKFMKAVEDDADWELMFPDTNSPNYTDAWDGNINKWIESGGPVVVHKTMKAREVWNEIITSAWASAEPGLFFIDRANQMANSYYYEKGDLICCNPCQPSFAEVLTPEGIRTFGEIGIGSIIWSGERWTKVVNKWSNGTKPVFKYQTTAGDFIGTENHRVFQEGQRVEVKDAVAIDLAQGPKEIFAAEDGSLDPQDVMDGMVIGDGTTKDSKVLLCLGQDDQSVLNSEVAHLIIQQYGKATEFKIITTISKQEVPKTYLREIPERFLKGTRRKVFGFLRGLYSANGSIVDSRITLKAASFKVISQVQHMLSSVGISSYYTTNKASMVTFSNGDYESKQSYDLNIGTRDGREAFSKNIGFVHPYKQEKLLATLESGPRSRPYKSSYEVISVEDLGEHEVFDITVDDERHSYWTGGLLVSNCGEQPLPAWSVCNLGHINLAQFVTDVPHFGLDVNWEELRKAVRYATRFLDNVIDATPYFSEGNKTQQLGERRVGLGTIGLAEMLIRLEVAYGSEESLEIINKVYQVIAEEAYLTSAEIAAEKGAFPWCNKDLLCGSKFIQSLPVHIQNAVEEHGLRNVTLLTQAPTGTVGTMIGTSTGIEPFYFWSYFRKGRLGVHEEKVNVYRDWQEANPHLDPETQKPAYFVNAMDLAPEGHVKVQAAIQRWVDSAISKTCNVPSTYTVEETRKLYELMHKLGCKGGTIYRDKSRDEQVLNLDKPEEIKINSEAPVVDSKSLQKEVGPKLRPRPYKRFGATVSKQTPGGTAHVTMNDDEDGNPFEVFVDIGKGGSDIRAMAEGLGRLCSLILRLGSGLTAQEKIEEIINQLSGIGGQRSIGFGSNRVKSLPDALAQALEEHYGGEVFEANDGVLGDYFEEKKVAADLCPGCGDVSLMQIEGCSSCPGCGHSEC